MITYLCIGVVFMGIVDILLWLYLPERIQDMDLKTRAFCIILWPIGLYMLITNFMNIKKD